MALKFSPQEMRRIRNELGMTQEQLGDAYGNRSSVNAYECGRVVPGLATIGRLARLLGCSPMDLTTEQEASE